MKISDYAPYLYNKNTEFINIIYTEEKELETKLKVLLENIFKDTFAKVATKNGIENWETLLDIKLDSNKNNLEYRRNVILNKMSTTGPLSYKWLEQSLTNLLGANNYTLSIDNEHYTLTINIANILNNTAESVFDLYRPLIPANLILTINLFEEEIADLYVGIVIHEGEHMILESEVA